MSRRRGRWISTIASPAASGQGKAEEAGDTEGIRLESASEGSGQGSARTSIGRGTHSAIRTPKVAATASLKSVIRARPSGRPQARPSDRHQHPKPGATPPSTLVLVPAPADQLVRLGSAPEALAAEPSDQAKVVQLPESVELPHRGDRFGPVRAASAVARGPTPDDAGRRGGGHPHRRARWRRSRRSPASLPGRHEPGDRGRWLRWRPPRRCIGVRREGHSTSPSPAGGHAAGPTPATGG